MANIQAWQGLTSMAVEKKHVNRAEVAAEANNWGEAEQKAAAEAETTAKAKATTNHKTVRCVP